MANADDIKAALDTLTATVTNTSGVIDSAVAAFEGIAAQMVALADDPAAITALAGQLDSKAQALAAAIPAVPHA